MVTVLLPGLCRLVPGGKLLFSVFSRFDTSETPFVLPAVFLKDFVAPSALRPFLDGGGAPAELPGRAGAAAILCRDPSRDGEVPSTVPASPDWNLPSDTFPEGKVYQVTDCIGGIGFPRSRHLRLRQS